MRQDRRIQQQQDALQSLSSTTRALAEAWLAGQISGTYTQTALEQTFLLVEKNRATLAASPDILIDPRGAQLSVTAERLARLIARIISDVRGADAAAARVDIAALPFSTGRKSQ
jgi:hypothetical protein